MSDVHEIFAIKYGRHERKKAENYIGGDPHDTSEPIDYYVWAITGPSGTFVVDTGFDAAMAKKRGRVISKPIAEGLKAIDIAPDSVKDVIISHLHYDHCGNYDTFPNARFHLQDTEMAYATAAACATSTCASRSRKKTWSRWCARCLPAASRSTTG